MIPNETEVVVALPQSNWYSYLLDCGHRQYSRVRLTYEKRNRQYHKIMCGYCTGKKNVPTAWQDVAEIEVVTDEHVSNVLSGNAFVLPSRIMRLDYSGATPGNPFPYSSSRNRDY